MTRKVWIRWSPAAALLTGACAQAPAAPPAPSAPELARTTDVAPEAPPTRAPEAPPTRAPAASPTQAPAQAPAQASLDPVAALRAHVAALRARPEQEVVEIEVQHLLVSFAGAGTAATRSKEEAEALAAELFASALAGADFDGLVKRHTDDSHPGVYGLTTGQPSRKRAVYPRRRMVPAFGDVGYRLEVGELGVAPWHKKDSPYGWHIIRRTR